MKVLAIKMSPRKNWNTAQLLKSAADGARSTGAEVEYMDLYDLNFTGCRSCLLCKRKGAERCHCYWKDDLSPVIDKVFASDALLLGTPIYFGRPTSHYFAFMERLCFTMLSYDNYSNYFNGKVNAALFLTMNASEEYYHTAYQAQFEEFASGLKMLHGNIQLYPCFNTLQVQDYSKFSMAGFDEAVKKQFREEQFPKDLENAFQIGAEISKSADTESNL